MKISALWEHNLKQDEFVSDNEFLNNLKQSFTNFKLSYWNPKNNGMRYFKMLLYNLAINLTSQQKLLILNTKNRHIGNPISVDVDDLNICFDYLQAALETDYILCKWNPIDVLEIGAGYGRTAHMILSNSTISQYTIMDLPECLKICQHYLSKVLSSDHYNKLRFIDVLDHDSFVDLKHDLCLNINSFADMDRETVFEYLGLINENCNAFYCKNAVGKYWDPELDDHIQGSSVVKKAMQMGPLTDIVDIHDQDSVLSASKKFLKVYRPSGGWKTLSSSWAPPISHYWQAIYIKEKMIK
ncbi:methyltransferase [archaeon]|nr:methyltransferase [archaeon]